MKTVFVDTLYWIARINPKDQWHEAAKQARATLGDVFFVTTDEVLGEFLAAMSRGGPVMRQKAVETVRAIIKNTNTKVMPQSRGSFLKAMDRYEARKDKEYSLVDCSSMNAMEAEGIQESLTHDQHFVQEGFATLIRKE